MKRILVTVTAAMLGLMLLAGCNQQQADGLSVGVVDEARAFKENKLAASAMAYLQKLGEPMQKKAEDAYNTMQEDQNEENVAAYKLAMGELQNVMNGEQQRIVALIDAKFNEVLEQYRAENGLTLIMSKESVIASDNTIDITDDIIAAMDAIEIDFEATAPKAGEADKE